MSRYSEYLLSDDWRNRRMQCLSSYNHKCDACDQSSKLEIHHLTYDRVFNEDQADLIPLCKTHHLTVELLCEAGFISKSGSAEQLKRETLSAIKNNLVSSVIPKKFVPVLDVPPTFPKPRNETQAKLMADSWFVKAVALKRTTFKKIVKRQCRRFENKGTVSANAFVIYDKIHGLI